MSKKFLLLIILFLSIINPVAGINFTISPENPVVGQDITIRGTGGQPNQVFYPSITFEKTETVVDGIYDYRLTGIKIPSGDNNFVATAKNVNNLNVRVKILFWWTVGANAVNGIATVSQSNVPSGTYDIRMDGDAAQGASSVNLLITASSKITADPQGNFVYKYSSSGIPPGDFTLNIGGTTKTINLSAAGAVSTAPPQTSSSSSASGGGGAGISAENPDNIEIREKYGLRIYNDKVTSYRFKNESSPILYVNITGNVTANDINTVVETLRNTSSLVKFPSPGAVYKNINVWVGTGGFAVPRNIKEGIISFRVKNIWIDENNLTRSDINMLMWNGGEWLMLETVNTSNDGTYTYYESKTNTFSAFVIGGFKNELDSKEKPMMISTPIPTITSSQTLQAPAPTLKEVPGFEILPAIIALIVLRRRS